MLLYRPDRQWVLIPCYYLFCDLPDYFNNLFSFNLGTQCDILSRILVHLDPSPSSFSILPFSPYILLMFPQFLYSKTLFQFSTTGYNTEHRFNNPKQTTQVYCSHVRSLGVSKPLACCLLNKPRPISPLNSNCNLLFLSLRHLLIPPDQRG